MKVGAFLSGGIDSSSVVQSIKNYIYSDNLNTFSVGFEGKWDESHYINLVKDYFKTNHHHYYFNKEDYEDIDSFYHEIYDEPFADYSSYPTYFLSKKARKHVTVCLSGDGGDELFGGYNKY